MPYLFVLFLCLLPVSAISAPPSVEQNSAVIFMYHRFGESTLPSTNIRMEQFDAQLAFLDTEGFTVWPLRKLVNALEKRLPIPDKTVSLTIDDAYRSVYTHAYPRLKAKGWPFTVFVSSDYIDKKYGNYMTWEQMRELAADDVEFGLHSASHTHLIEQNKDETPSHWKARIREDLLKNQRRLEEELNIKPRLLAYPFGEYDEQIEALVASLGWVAFGQHSGAVGHGADLQALPRYPVSEHYGDMEGFSSKALSLYFPVSSVSPADPVLNNAAYPTMEVAVDAELKRVSEVQCYATGKGKVAVEWLEVDKKFKVSPEGNITTRRARYNCTVPSTQPGRFHWFSQPWILPWIAE